MQSLSRNTPSRFSTKPVAHKLSQFDEERFDDSFPVDFRPYHAGDFIIHLDGPIRSAAQFRNAVRALENADEDHGVELHLQSLGGSLGATDYFLHAMRKCQGHIHSIASGECASACTLILLASDSIELTEGFIGMFHCGSLGSIGAYNEYAAKSKFDLEYMPRVLRSQYRGFFSEEELDEMMKGVDRWMDAQEFVERWQRRNEFFNALEQHEQDEHPDGCPCDACEASHAVGLTD
jgi:ATP-dependent protease ClpP protease subunit